MSNFNWDLYQTDKTNSGHSYCRAYDKFLLNTAKNAKKILEIGTRPGSVKLWLDYFPNATVYGIDIKTPNFKHPRFKFEIVNQSNLKSLENFFDKHGYDFDVIIDDGPHRAIEQIITFNLAFPKMKSASVYVVEDLHCGDSTNEEITNYKEMKQDSEHTFLELTRLLLDEKAKHQISNKYLTNSKIIVDSIHFAELEKADKIRWKAMNKPSDIAFFIRK
jgi:hypothetical protein